MPEHDAQAVIDQLVDLFEQIDDLAPPVNLTETEGWLSGEHGKDASASSNPYRRRRQAAGVAAACVVLAGAAGVWWLTARDTGSRSLRPADTISAATDPAATTIPEASVDASPAADGTSDDAAESIVDRVATADPWEAARLFQLDAHYRASPAQAADLAIANELTSRACFEEQGFDLAPFDPTRLAQWEQSERSQWERRRQLWTPQGQQHLRENGASAFRNTESDELPLYPHETIPWPPECYPAATGITYLGTTWVWSEEQLQSSLMGGDGDGEWAPLWWGFGRLPGTEDAKRISDQCMIERGWDQWSEPGAYQSLYTEPEASDAELDQMSDLIECNQQADATAIYLTESAEYVRSFRIEFADELDQIDNERSEALDDAYEVLRAAGLEPLSD